MVYIRIFAHGSIYAMRGLSAVVRHDELGAMRRPGRVGRITGKFHAFLYSNLKHQVINIMYEKENLKSVDSYRFI